MSSIVVAAFSAMLFASVGLLWFMANVRFAPDVMRLPIIFFVAVLALGY